MKLYTHPLSPACRKLHGIIAHTGLQVERVPVDLLQREQYKPEYQAINPNSKVPALVDGDLKLWESNAIACYLATKAQSSLWPATEQRYDIMRWMFWEAGHWSQAFATIIGQKVFNRENPNQELIAKGVADFRKLATTLDNHLKGRSFISGEALTIADFAVGTWLGYAVPLELPLSEFPEVSAWYKRLSELPAWKEVVPPAK